MKDDGYRLGFNYNGIIKLTYRIIIGFIAVQFGLYLWENFPSAIEWFMALDGIDPSKIREAHISIAKIASVIILPWISYGILLGIVKKYIVKYKERKPRSVDGDKGGEYDVVIDEQYDYKQRH